MTQCPIEGRTRGSLGPAVLMSEAVSAEGAPRAIGPYSQAVRSGGFLFCSGQLGLDPVTGELTDGGVGPQATRALENVGSVLETAGLGFQHVVKTTIFLTSMQDFGVVNEAYASFFTEPFPARSTIAVARLPRDALVEIEVIAEARPPHSSP